MAIDDEFESDDLFGEAALAEDEWQESYPEFLDPITMGVATAAAPRVIGRLLSGGPRRAPLGRVRTGQGVGTARLNTPRGSATLQLPSKVPTIEQFKALESAVNVHSARLNNIHGDMESLRKQAATVVADVAKEVSKGRREQGSGAMMSLMMSMMTQQGYRDQLERHMHAGAGPAVVPDDDNMMMIMPLMLGMGGGGSGGDDSSMMMVMAMMMMNRN
jgi:hypothetical protein